jgi:hypothetical protein
MTFPLVSAISNIFCQSENHHAFPNPSHHVAAFTSFMESNLETLCVSI